MGGLVTCRRRSTFEPLPEPEPVSDNPDSETSSDYHQFDSPLSQAAVEEPEVSASQPDPTVVEGPEVAVSQPDPSTLILAEVRRTVGGFNLDFVRPEIVNWESTTLRIYCIGTFLTWPLLLWYLASIGVTIVLPTRGCWD